MARAATHRVLYGYVWRTTAPQQIPIIALTFVIAPLAMIPLELQRRIVDDAVSGGAVGLLVVYSAFYLAIVLVQGGLKYWLNLLKARVLELVARDLRLLILERTRTSRTDAEGPATLPVDTGTMVSVLLAESEDVGGFASDSFAVPILQTCTIFWVMGYLIWVQPAIAMLAIAIYAPQAILVPLVQQRINRMVRMKTKRMRRLGDDEVRMMSLPAEGFFSFARQAQVLVGHVFQIRMRIYRLKYFLTFLGNFLDSMGPLMVMGIGGYLVIIGQTSVATLVVFISGLQRVADPWDVLINFFRTVSVARVSYGMIDDVLNARLPAAVAPGEAP